MTIPRFQLIQCETLLLLLIHIGIVLWFSVYDNTSFVFSEKYRQMKLIDNGSKS